jgi:surface antigen
MATPTAARVIQVARSQLGYREGRNNDTKYGRWYGANHQPWCAMFVSWIAAATGATAIIPKHAYTPSGAKWFKDRGRWGTRPRIGAIVYFNFPGDGVDRISHVGIVEKVNADGSIITIEGNTNDSGSREGNGVYRKQRKVGIVGYGYPAYATATTPFPLPADHAFGRGGRGNTLVHDGTRSTQDAASVKRIQRKLGGKVTGFYGPLTHARMVARQIAWGWKPNGRVGIKAWRRLGL